MHAFLFLAHQGNLHRCSHPVALHSPHCLHCIWEVSERCNWREMLFPVALTTLGRPGISQCSQRVYFIMLFVPSDERSRDDETQWAEVVKSRLLVWEGMGIQLTIASNTMEQNFEFHMPSILCFILGVNKYTIHNIFVHFHAYFNESKWHKSLWTHACHWAQLKPESVLVYV